VQLLMGLFLLSFIAVAIAQQYGPSSNLPDLSDGLLRPSIEETTAQTGTTTSDSARTLPDAPSHTARPTASEATRSAADMTNFRPSGAGTAPSLATSSTRYLNFSASNSGGSGSLIFTGGNATTADSVDARSGTSGPGASCGRTSVDKSNGSDWINSILAITSHKGGRYCALGEGGFWKRGTYAATRAFVAHRYDGNSFNASELLGPGNASAMPGSYYAYPNYTGERLAARYASAVGRDTLKNMFSEFWPDFATHVLRRHP